MNNLFSLIIPALNILKILGNTDLFQKWLLYKHPNIDSKELFEGYRFSISCCLNAFADGISNDRLLGIKNDFLLDRAITNLIPIHQIENSCEKTIFLKNIKPYIANVRKASSLSEIKSKINEFEVAVSSRFDKLYDRNITISKRIRIEKQTALKIALINFTHTFLIQIKNNGPVANFLNPLSVDWIKQESKESYFEGYKYAIQFLWVNLLGESIFNKTSLVNLHKADSWRKYKYIKTNSKNKFNFFNKEFDIAEQTCFDSYFFRIKNEITNQLQNSYKFHIYTIESYFNLNSKDYDKTTLFSDLLSPEKLKKYAPNFNHEEGEEIQYLLYWYPIEIVDSEKSQLHYGIPSFNTMLAGTVVLHNPQESEFHKIIVAKFTHPISNDNKKNDYSYGILVDTKSAAGYYSSGWVIYQNVCGDYSGFSGCEYKTAEKLIERYKKKNKIELRGLTISFSDFKKYTDKFILNNNQISIIDQNKLVKQIIQDSRSYVLELFTFYVFSSDPYFGKKFDIKLNADKNNSKGEKDVILSNSSEVILIECKITPQNQNYKELINKLEAKLNDEKYSRKSKSIQLWFWYEPSKKNIEDIEKFKKTTKINVVCVSNSRGAQMLNQISISSLKNIMQDY